MNFKPQDQVPELNVVRIGGKKWSLHEQDPENFTLLVFYRGLHCPICKDYLNDLQDLLDDFISMGVAPIAISCDSKERAESSAKEWGVDKLPLAYDLSLATAREWGLYISESINAKEPSSFSEPGVFLVRPDGTLYAASVQTMPFARPPLKELKNALQFILEKDYPARGGAA